jgi:tetratricopeptide (TPR) repeat protein
VFAVQDEIATAIVNALRITMSPSDIKEIARERPADAKAYDLYLKGRQKYRVYSREAMQEAMDLFREAIALEPNYALAWAGVADCYAQFLQYGWTDDREEFGRLGLEAARKAVAIDPDLPEAHKAEATVLTMTHGDREEILRTLRRAIEVDPNFTPALSNLGVHAFVVGNLAAVERLNRRILEIDPQECHGLLWLSWVLYWTNRPAESLTAARRIHEVSESDFYLSLAYFTEIACLVSQGEFEAAAEVLSRARTDRRVDPGKMIPAAGFLELRRGRLDEARSLAHRIPPETLPNPLALATAVELGFKIGEPELSVAAINRLGVEPYLAVLLRMSHGCHPMLDREPFAPRKAALTLTWPLQAPMIDEARYALFEEVRIKSGRPEGTELLEKAPPDS